MKWPHWCVVVVFCFSSMAFAVDNQELSPKLILNQIKMIKEGELLGDDLYFDISVLRIKQPTQYIRIPEFPLHFPSSKINTLQPTLLWSDPIKSGEKVILIVSLMDQDSKPFNPDDVIGLIRVELKNEKGNLHLQWSRPNQKSAPMNWPINTTQKFLLSNANGQYELYLSILPQK
ncbi:hypothetical protein [Legionella qingyii]|uniref:hypothetical protein n=1 Tax=Legionella qingyii TaxID=2184757 RepID=UPI000F8DDFDD|nr:hypothetical protein [Legionella qingyii]RUR29233.1 hypothetical protein ELY16_00090 [Legionella qingyii]